MGRGLVATKDISRGEIILKDRAVVTASDHDCSATKIQRQVDQLSKADRDDYYKLAGIEKSMTKSSSIFFTCAIDNGKGTPLGELPEDPTDEDLDNLGNPSRSIYLGLSLLNHSCFANCALVSTTDTDTLELITVVDVKKGEELTVNYLGSAFLTDTTIERRRMLRIKWGFLCNCFLCSKGW